MKYQLLLARQAEKHCRQLPPKDQSRVKQVLQDMEESPLSGDVQKLRGYESYRRRVGNYRIIFTILDNELIVLVLDILCRNERTYK